MSTKDFKAYPRRQITLSEEVWDELKARKLAMGKNWNTFIKTLLYEMATKGRVAKARQAK